MASNSLCGGLKQLTSLQSVTLVLNGVTLDDLTEDADSLVHVSLSSLAHSASRCFVEYWPNDLLMFLCTFFCIRVVSAAAGHEVRPRGGVTLHKLLGSLDLIGNPAALFSDVRGGFRTFFREPRRGAALA